MPCLQPTGYSDALEQLLYDGLKLFNLPLKGKSVLLKPNLVEYSAGAAINTEPALVGAATVAFLRLGARSVTVAEGPGHQRDTYLLLVESGLGDQLRDRGMRFVDLNRDDVVKWRVHRHGSPLVAEDGSVLELRRVDAEDKSHHWAGVTLSMKYMFGVIPGSCYGWPKNVLHWQGIHESILDICATVPIHFVIADGIVAMTGNGPLNGTNRPLNKIVLADDPVAADFTCARLPGGMTEAMEGSALSLQFGPLKGQATGTNRGKQFLARALSGVGTVAAFAVGRPGDSPCQVRSTTRFC